VGLRVGRSTFSKALDELGDCDPVQYLAVAAAYFPDVVRKVIKDNLSAKGFTEEESRVLFPHMEVNPTRH
jgi:hypothetical protein